MTDPEFVDPSELRPGPIRRQSLPTDLLEYVEAVYDVIGLYLGMTYEEFEVGFMRDANPSREVAVWCNITAAWIAYHDKYMGDEMLPDEDERKLVSALAAISAGVEDVEALGLPVEMGRRLLECYEELE